MSWILGAWEGLKSLLGAALSKIVELTVMVGAYRLGARAKSQANDEEIIDVLKEQRNAQGGPVRHRDDLLERMRSRKRRS